MVYNYNGESYEVDFYRYLLSNSKGYTDGDNEVIYVDKVNPEDIMLMSSNGNPTVIVLVIYGVFLVVSLILILIPQGKGE